VLERTAREVDARAPAEPTRAALLLAAKARIFLDGMDDPLRAQEALQRASLLAPDARFVINTWRWLAEQGADPHVTLERAREELAHLDGAERIALLWYIASIQEHVAGDLAGAEGTMREILALNPADAGAWDAIGALRIRARLLGDDGGGTSDDTITWSGVIEALNAMAQATTDPILAGALHGAAGALHDRFFDEDAALTSLRRALDSAPNNLSARATIQNILLRRRDWDEYVQMLVVEASAIQDPRASRDRWERAGDVYAERLGDYAHAAQCFLRAAALADYDPGPLDKLVAVLEAAGRWDDAATAYDRLLQRLHDAATKSWALVRLGRLRETRQENREDEALAAYRLAVETAPSFTPAVQALLAMAQQRGHHALVLELERREAERIADPKARAVRWSALAERLEAASGPREEVILLHERVLALEPMNQASFEALDRMYRAMNQWPRVITLYEAAIESTEDVRRRRALRLELAELFQSRTSQPVKAAQILREVLDEPEPEPVVRFDKLVALARAYADAEKWPDYIATLEEQAKLLEGDDAIATLYRIGAVVEARIGDPQRALLAYGEVLARDPTHEAAAIATLRIHEREGHWEHVITARRRLVEIATRPEDVALGLIDIARVQEERLGREGDAIITYSEALERMPTSLPVLGALERLLRKTGQHERLATALQRVAEATTDATQQVRLLMRAAMVLELCVEDPALASEAYGRALDATIMSGELHRYPALWGALRLHEVRGEHHATDRILMELLDMSPEPTARLRVLVRLARTRELRLDDPQRAAKHWDDALMSGARPAEVSVDRVRVARLCGRVEMQSEALHDLVSATADKELARGLLRRMALAAEHDVLKVRGTDEAIAIYTRLLADNPEDPQALDGMVRCAAAASALDDSKLAQALIARARATADVPLRTLFAFAAAVIDDAAGRTSDAEVGYTFALLTDPSLLPALDAARALRAQAADWQAVAQLHERAATSSLDPENAARSWLDSAEVQEARLGSTMRALESYRALLMLQPEHPRAFARALELMESSMDWHGAVKVLQAHAEAVTDPAVKVKCYTQRAGILAGRLGATPGAIADLRRAMALRTDEEDPATLEVLALLEERVKNWQEALQLHGRVAEAASDAQTRRRARLAQARILEDELSDHAKAEVLLRELADEHPDDREVRLRLANAAAHAGHEERALDLYSELSESGAPADRVRALVSLAYLVRSRPDAWPASQAENALSRAFDIAIQEPSAIAALEDRFVKDGDFRPFVQQAEASIGRVPPNTEGILAMRTALAKVYRERLGNPDASDRQLIAAIQAFPESIPTRLALAANLRGRNDEGALTELRGAVKADPFSPEPFQALVTLAVATGRPEIGVLVASAASLLGASAEEVRITLDDAVPLRPIHDALLPEDAMSRLVGPSRCWPLRAIFQQLDPFLPKLFPGSEQLLATHPHLPESYTIVGEARAIAACLGAPAPLLVRGKGREALLLQTEPRALVLGQDLLGDGARATALFHVAHACTRIAAQGSIYTVPREQVRALLDAVLPTNVDTPLVRDLRKRIGSVLPRKNKKELERVVAQATQDPRPELPTWEVEEARRALFAALILSRDLRAVAQAIAPEVPPDLERTERRAALAKNPTMRDALEFCVSPQCWDVFRRVYGRA
jgi:methionyl-tRNA formyltransferase